MLIKKLKDCKNIPGGDNTVIKEVLHPKNDPIVLSYSIAHASLNPGKKSLKHKMKTTEVYYILEGHGIMHVDNESQEVARDSVVFIPPKSLQYIENVGKDNLDFLCFVSPPWRFEDEIDFKS